jgi:hypothetical protein
MVIFHPLFHQLLSTFTPSIFNPSPAPSHLPFLPNLIILYVAVVLNLAARLEESAHIATVPRSFSVGRPCRFRSVLVQAGHSKFCTH